MLLPVVTAQVSFSASASKQVVDQNEPFRLVFELENAAGQNFTPPSFKNFEVISGPNQGSNTTIVNGQVSRSARITYDLLAPKPGKFILEPARVLIDKKQVVSNVLTITVKKVEQSLFEKGLNNKAEVQLRLNTPKDTVYVGEELRLEIELISKVDIRTYSVLKALNTDGIRKEDLRNYNLAERRIEVDGSPQSARTIQAISLFPSKPGTYTVGPVIIQANVLLGKPSRSRSFFFTPATRAVDATSNALELTVLPLPQPEAEGFIGAVGNWRFQGQYADLSDMTTADALTFKLFVQGQGDAGRLQAPELSWPDGWRAYPPETTTDHSVETDTGLVHTRVYEYTVAPVRGGTFNLRPKASYFSADSNRYLAWSMAPRTIAVTDVGTNLSDPTGAPEANLFVVEATPRPAQSLWVDQSWFWWILASFPLMLGLAWLGKMATKKNSDEELSELKDPIAEGKRRLQKARASIADPNAFYQEVREALQQYAHDRLGLPPSQQSPSEIRSAFAKTAGGEVQGQKFMDASELADRGLYGGGTDEEGRRTALAELERLLSE
ncbi:MAG: BatD family protein [Saprospiraceae bacterium]